MFPDLNIHPALVHFPIAFFLLASAAGLLYLFLSQRAELKLLTWAAMGLGMIGALAAVLSGLLAQAGLPPDPPYRAVLNQHIGTGLAQIVVYGFLLYRRRLFGTKKARAAREQAGDDATDLLDQGRARWWVAAMLVLGALLVVVSGWNGGRLVYEWGVNVMQ